MYLIKNQLSKGIFITFTGFVGAPIFGYADVQCGDVITTIETMDQDLIDCPADPAVTVQGPTGILFMNGHTIQCDLGDGTGILLEGTAGFVSGDGEVRQCTVGISVEGVGFHTVQEVFAFVNTNASIEVISDYNSVRFNDLQNSLFNGVNILGENNSLVNNVLFNFGGTGIYINGDSALVSGNAIDINGGDAGIILDVTNGSRIIQNEVVDAEDGIIMTASGQLNNVISSNVVSGSVNFDLLDQNADACTSSNVWFGNIVTTTDPACLE
ncbi:hypothetical protein BTJ40_11760 [Microbulbifer sp. A4B17]|nr:hypothetical protein BTJ40_11760 [Microbulbifer sp. A4B17]